MSAHPRTELESALALCKGSFLSVGFFSFFVNLLMLVPSFYMLQVYDRAVGSASLSTLLMLTLIMLLLMTTMGGLEWVRSRIMVRVSTRLDSLLGRRLFDASFRQALNTGGMNASGQPLSDLSALRQFLTGNGLFAFFDTPWIPIYLGIMFMFHPWYGWMGVLSALLLGTLAFVNEKLTRSPLQAANRQQMMATAFVSKSLRNAEVVESMGMLASLREHWSRRVHEVLILQSLASDRGATIAALSRTFRQIVQSLVLGLGAYLTITHRISPGQMIAGSILLGRALAPIDQLIGVWKGFLGARAQYARLHELLIKVAAEPERMQLPAPEGAIHVEGLSVGAPDTHKPIIRGLDFQVSAGEVVGIIGPSGAGKSTLARALLGIWPRQAGTVRLDAADISQWRREALGQYIGYLPQDIELFEGTISQNISRFGPADAPAVVAAARMAGVHELVLQLPEGYDTVIGANGAGLSGGQRQRIGLARALYGEPRLVVLDEPNSNLDDAGEKMLAEALRKLRQSRATVFVITHRSGVLAQVDKLLVLNQGELSLFGPRDNVLARLQGVAPAVQPATAIQS
ncbi:MULTISPECIES: type I secretion system permease/ATPase [unclassified Pseudomonas]|uniref:type I secretion system permease/ATPase n=1 Tax=unclassified Pseudomonas TaxID=196821 RepID=UPI00119E743A|nr:MULTISPECIES: type I secretion system permease/ATPase [unclassified Pseudomonas]TWC22993.1 ATP-binding cassette subfamily C protein EexD [Pseudomonas sp. SJZ075]TWC38127.1 ATP-binding cassette subfamily C protein EexD [Pseudomonas sp. SJZ078]TWC58717.1 ATP-binding cassette subfamily C protein EexD [Pseudomonas sp. SJZ124]TWC94418.1 ATP-binding cassette subfamily C protein EexD [Pseudomonas sp. SJZ101]